MGVAGPIHHLPPCVSFDSPVATLRNWLAPLPIEQFFEKISTTYSHKRLTYSCLSPPRLLRTPAMRRPLFSCIFASCGRLMCVPESERRGEGGCFTEQCPLHNQALPSPYPARNRLGKKEASIGRFTSSHRHFCSLKRLQSWAR